MKHVFFCLALLLALWGAASVYGDFDFDDMQAIEKTEQGELLEKAKQEARNWHFDKADNYLEEARQKAYDPAAVKETKTVIADERNAYEKEQERKREIAAREKREKEQREMAAREQQEREQREMAARSNSGSYGGGSSLYQSDSGNKSANESGKSKKGVAKVYRDGKYTVIVCNDGRKKKVFHDDYGECVIESAFGSYSCDWAIKDTMKGCGE